MTNLDSILKSRDITLPTKVSLVKTKVFPVVRYGSESWTIKEAERRIDAFELWCQRTLESPLDCKEIQLVQPKGNQPWIFTGRTDAVAPILWLPDAKSQLIRKDPDAGKIEGGRRRDDRGWDSWTASPTQWTWVWVNSGSWWWTGRPGVLQSTAWQRVGHDWATELNWIPTYQTIQMRVWGLLYHSPLEMLMKLREGVANTSDSRILWEWRPC